MVNLIAHRGFADVYPENTILAFEQASEQADMVELDVRMCANNEVVVFHDSTLDRVTNFAGDVSQASFTALKGCNVLESGEGVPLLEEVFESVPSEVTLHVEIKDDDAVTKTLELINMYEHDGVISSFLPHVLEDVREQSDVDTALLFAEEIETGVDGYYEDIYTEDTNPVEMAVELDCTGIHPPKTVVDDAFVTEAHDAGLEVNVWTFDEDGEANRYVEYGIDGVIADNPSVL